MHHRHKALVLFELLSFNVVKDTKQEDYLEAIYHNHIHHVNDFLIDCNLVLEPIVLDEGTVSRCIIIWFNLKVTTNTILFDYFSSVDLLLNVEFFPCNHVIEVLLFQVLKCQPVLD